MKKVLPVILLLLIATSSFATGIEGTWNTKIQGPDGDMELTFVFKMDGQLLFKPHAEQGHRCLHLLL